MIRLRRPAWTRRTRVQNLNQNVLWHLPAWTQEEVDAQRARAQVKWNQIKDLIN